MGLNLEGNHKRNASAAAPTHITTHETTVGQRISRRHHACRNFFQCKLTHQNRNLDDDDDDDDHSPGTAAQEEKPSPRAAPEKPSTLPSTPEPEKTKRPSPITFTGRHGGCPSWCPFLCCFLLLFCSFLFVCQADSVTS